MVGFRVLLTARRVALMTDILYLVGGDFGCGMEVRWEWCRL